MTQNYIIYLCIIIFSIICFALYFRYEKKELYTKNELNNVENNVAKYATKNPNNINLSTENITQYKFKQLFLDIEKINKEKIVLNNKSNHNFYTQSTTDDKLRMDLDIISKYVILLLNNNNYYEFSKTNFGDVDVWVDKDGNEEFKYELFLWDKKNYFEIKLLINIIKFIEEKEIDKYGIKEKDLIFPDFNIGLPFKDQIIPLPTDVIITGHLDTATSSIKPNIPKKIKYLYLNQIEIYNSTLIVDYNKDKYPFHKLDVDENGFSGITDMSLEYIKIKGGISNPYLENGRQYNKWPTLDEEPKYMGQYPSKSPPKHWDNDGVYYYDKLDKLDKKLCNIYEPGTRWSEDKELLQPNYWPTLATLPRNCGENYWLFDLSNSSYFRGNLK